MSKTVDDVPRTLFVADEVSGVNDEYYGKVALKFLKGDRVIYMGAPWPAKDFFGQSTVRK